MQKKEEARLSTQLTRAQRRGVPATLTLTEWLRTTADFHSRCAYCGGADASVMEHFVPVGLGGGTTAGNCLPSCEPCNERKGSKHPDALSQSLGMATLAGLRRYLAGRSTGVDVVPRAPTVQRRRPSHGRTEKIVVTFTASEWQQVSAAAAIGGESVSGYLRRIALMHARSSIANAGCKPPAVTLGKGGAQ